MPQRSISSLQGTAKTLMQPQNVCLLCNRADLINGTLLFLTPIRQRFSVICHLFVVGSVQPCLEVSSLTKMGIFTLGESLN
jgi:hypothetical protein